MSPSLSGTPFFRVDRRLGTAAPVTLNQVVIVAVAVALNLKTERLEYSPPARSIANLSSTAGSPC